MADVDGGVLVRPPAAQAPLRVRRVQELGSRLARIVEAEDERARMLAREIADLRIVAVDDELRVRVEPPHDAPPTLRDVLELPVTVELIAEQVPEADRARPDAPRDLRQRRLVYLEQPQLRVLRREKRRRDPRAEVRPRSVVSNPDPRRQDVG